MRPDLATYDFAKRYLMNHFDFEDNYKTHTLSRLAFFLRKYQNAPQIILVPNLTRQKIKLRGFMVNGKNFSC